MNMENMDYTTFKLGDEPPIAGMMAITGEMGPMPPHWGTYFTVDDADEAVRKATELGGSVMMPAMDIPNVGRFAALTSPQGVMFSVIKYSMPTA
jgi:predicted enzyme related to lactoylglutathione lyase